ncbi:MAG: hypothetical protein KF833_01545 [Verrucomicrobiae bacterium]|nr:hypothetical protein [Verrucomicrobiae bacterium]
MTYSTKLATAALALALATGAHATQIVYNNLVNPLGNYIGGFPYEEVADDIQLSGSARIFESITVGYAGFNFDGDETLTVSLYRMDGAPTPGSFGFNTPGSLLFSSTVPIGATDGTTLTIPGNGIILPDYLGVGFSFGGVDFDPTGAGSDGGPLLFDPIGEGSSFEDYWLRGYPNPGDPWALFTFGGEPPVNLGIQISARSSGVPDAGSTLGLTGLAALGLLAVARRGRRTA